MSFKVRRASSDYRDSLGILAHSEDGQIKAGYQNRSQMFLFHTMGKKFYTFRVSTFFLWRNTIKIAFC